MTGGYLGGGLALTSDQRQRVEALSERLETLRVAYYAGTPSISDDAYDALEDELRHLAPAHPLLAKVGSPAVAETWQKARHETPMGSLNKVTDDEGLAQWLARCNVLLEQLEMPAVGEDLFVTEKLDGISIELVYRDGNLEDAITRGDGEIGELITPNVARMRGVPHRIPYSEPLSVRGEITVRFSDWKKHFEGYSNPRNTAAGTARRLDGVGSEHLTVLCYDLGDEVGVDDEVAKFALIRRLGFATPSSYQGSIEEVLELHQAYAKSKRGALDYEIDGLVVRANSLAIQAALGELNRRPRAAVAYKFASPQKVSTVLELRWETGSSGRVTPIAVFEPVELAGAMVRRASLHNMAHVRQLGVGVGDEVLVSRRNDVIPYIEEVVCKVGMSVEPPSSCQSCGGPLVVEGEYLMCEAGDCPKRIEGRIHNWIDALGALEWGDKLIETLVAQGLVSEPAHLYRLTVEDIAGLERHGEKSADNALKQLRQRLPLRLETFLAALGIRGFSTQTARMIVQAGYHDLDAVLAADEAGLANVPGLGEIKAKAIVAGLQARAAEIERLCAAGVGPVTQAQAGALSGKSFCITGTHSRSRKVLVNLIEDAGGRVTSGVSKDLAYLLIADLDSNSSKAQKARRYDTVLIDEAALLEMLEP